jgi:hypothetical protein
MVAQRLCEAVRAQQATFANRTQIDALFGRDTGQARAVAAARCFIACMACFVSVRKTYPQLNS